MLFKNADLASRKGRHLLREPWEILAQLRRRVRVGGNCKRNPLLYCQVNNSITWIKFAHRLAPSSGGEFDCEIPRPNKIERFIDDGADLRTRSMTMNLNEVDMSEAIDEPRCSHFANTAKVVGVNRIDITAFELPRAIWHPVEHLIGAIKEVHRAQDKIEFVPMLLDPFLASRRVNRIVIELNTGADS